MAITLKDAALIGGALYLLARLGGNYAYNNFSAVGAKVKFGQLNWQGANGTIYLKVKNDTPAPVTVQQLSGKVLYSGTPIAQFVVNTPFAIQPNSVSEYPISFFVPYEGVTNTLTNAIATGNFATFATIEGVAKVAGLNIPFSYPLSPFA